MMVLVCLQARHVSGLPASAEGHQILVRLLHQEQETAAAARCEAGGVASFHDQVLLLHCAPVNSAALITVSFHLHNHEEASASASRVIDLTAQLHHPSPSVLSFVLGGAGTAVLSLTLHHRLIRPATHSYCLPLPIPDCLRKTMTRPMETEHNKDYGDDDQSSSGFITIEKGTISRRHPPSDNLLTTDDDEGDNGKHTVALAEELEVEDEFLAKLEADDYHLHLDALIKDAEAEIALYYPV